MKKIFFLSMLLMISCKTKQMEDANPIVDEKGDLVGLFQQKDLLKEPFISWYTINYETYTPDSLILEEIKPLWKDVTIKGFIGTWCGDSKREVPRLYKVLTQSGFNLKNLTMIGLNREKKSPNNEQEKMNIERVPTFIFYRKGVEIGRYVEYTVQSLEQDILKILEGRGYVNPYGS